MRFTASGCFGRSAELAQLDSILSGVSGGFGTTIAVVAEPGLGKTRMTRELARLAAARGFAVTIGRATQGVSAPFRPLSEALLHLDRDHAVRRRRDLADLLPSLAPIVPSWSSRSTASETSIPVVGDAVGRVLDVFDEGVLVVLEDLHWADDETLAVVEYVSDNAGARPVLIAATTRPQPDVGLRMFRSLESRHASTTIELSPLDPEGVRALVSDCLDGAHIAEVDGFVVDRSDGNPLLAEELLAGLHSSGALRRSPVGWAVTSRMVPSVPMTLADAVTDRWRSLSEEDRSVLGAAAVLGRCFDWRTVATMVGTSGDAVLAALRRSEDLQLVEFRDGDHQFRHTLTCDVMRDLLPDDRRRAFGARALELFDRGDLRREHVVVAGLAEQAGDLDRAVRHLLDAAAEYLGRGAHASAVMALRRAELIARLPVDRVDVAIHLSEVLNTLGRADEAYEVATAALPVGEGTDPDRSARLRLGVARAAILTGDWVGAERQVVAAGEASTSTAIEAEIASVQSHVDLNLGRSERAIEHAEIAVARGVAAGRPEIACEALEVLGRHARFVEPDRSTEAFERAAALAGSAELPAWRLRALHELAVNDAFIHWRLDRLREVRREAREQSAVLTLAVVDLHEAGTSLIAGDAVTGEELTVRCLESCERYRLAMLPMALIHLAVARAFADDRASADEAIARALALAPDDPDVASQVDGWVEATFALRDGDLDRWWTHLDRAMDIVGDSAARIPSPWRGQWALAAAVNGNLEPAHRLRTSHARVVGLNRACLDLVDAATFGRRGLRARADCALDRADQLLSADRCDLPRHLDRLLVVRTAHGDGWGDPGAWLREADVWFADSGYTGLSGLARSLMRELDVPVPRRGRGDSVVPPELRAVGVTSREMDVLNLVVDRCTNREIATRLHLSVRTVEKHVASLLAKTATDDRRMLGKRFGSDADALVAGS